MKKVLAIVLALVMCASVGMMAFAADYTDADATVSGSTVITSAGDADTNVDILVNYTNISVTVPLDIAIVADVSGGTCFTPDNYAIINNSAIDVKIADAEVTEKDSSVWTLVAADPGEVVVDGANQVFMTFTGDSAWILAEDYDTANAWVIPATTSTTPGELAITVDAASSMLNTTDGQDDAFTVTYTFEAA